MAKVDIGSIGGNSHVDRNKPQNQNTSVKTSSKGQAPIVTRDKLVRDKKTFGQKVKHMFIQDDLQDIKAWLIDEVIGPGIKNLILDSIAMMFFHETYSTGRRRSNSSNTSYTTYYKSSSSRQDSRSSSRRKDRYYDDDRERVDYRNIVLTYKEDAETIVRKLDDLMDEYHKVSIGDLYSLVDITPKPTDFDWGWTDSRDISIRRVSDGFLIDVAEARFID